MDIKYIFVPYKGRFDANILLKGIFDSKIFCTEGEKERKKKVSSV